MVYVDLNPIRAEMATSPENSDFTSACDRIRARQANEKMQFLEASPRLCQGLPQQEIEMLKRTAFSADWLCPITRDVSRSGSFKDLKLDEYLEILDATGRLMRTDKAGRMPPGLVSVLVRLSVNTERWINTVLEYDGLFRRVVGCLEGVVAAAKESGCQWFHGIKACQEAFCPAT
jgi:hypothetical protein